MRCKVYRSLDNPSSLLGMKGAYLLWFAAALGASLFLSAMVGAATSSILGTMLFLILALASYFVVLYVQSLYSVKDLQKFFSALKIHHWVLIHPSDMHNLWN